MADIRDEHGRPIQLTDEHGRPVQLTDEHGVPMHLTGVATIGSELHHKKMHDTNMGSGTNFAPTPIDYAKHGAGAVAGVGKAATSVFTQNDGAELDKKQLQRSTSSSSSSEDDGQGGRRKKKGLIQKIKDKLPGHDKDKATTAHSTDTKVSSVGGGPVAGIRVEQQHHKKGFVDKIKDKLPGHH